MRFSAAGGYAGPVITRTFYDDDETVQDGKVPINWSDGDSVRIISSESYDEVAGRPWADYTVTPSSSGSEDGTLSVFSSGLKWGEAGSYTFSAVYPSPASPRMRARGDTLRFDASGKAEFRASVPKAQPYPLDMGLVFMVASQTVDYSSASQTVRLEFRPIVTVFDLKIGNPSTASASLSVKRVTIRSASDALSGSFAFGLENPQSEGAWQGFPGAPGALPARSEGVNDEVYVDFGSSSLTLAPGSAQWVTLVALPGTFSDGLTLEILTAENKKLSHSLHSVGSGSYSYQPARKYKLSTINVPAVSYTLSAGDGSADALSFTIKDYRARSSYSDDIIPGTISDAAGSQTGKLTVSSYKTVEGGSATLPLPLRYEYSYDGGQTWTEFTNVMGGGEVINNQDITVFPLEPSGASGQTSFDLSLGWKARTNETSHDRYRWRGGAQPVTGYRDLSLYDVWGNQISTGRNTANCYVVRQPGQYKFPLVYGNGIRKGQASSYGWYSTNTTGTTAASSPPARPYRLRSFVNAARSDITTSYILSDLSDEVSNPSWKAVLLWMDAEGLIQNSLSVVGANTTQTQDDFIQFETASAQNLSEGNALIALYNDDDGGGYNHAGEAGSTYDRIYWSWHIWVSAVPQKADVRIADYRYQRGQYIENSHQDLFPYALGFCQAEYKTYAAPEGKESLKIRLSQREGNASPIVLDITQAPFERFLNYGNNPYWQWGFPMPYLPSSYENLLQNKTWWNYSDAAEGSAELRTALHNTIADKLAHPQDFNPYDVATLSSSSANQYLNNWNRDQISASPAASAAVVKTVYDPCPYGYTIPNGAVLYGLPEGDMASTDVSGDAESQYINAVDFADTLRHTTWYWSGTSQTQVFALHGEIRIFMTGCRRSGATGEAGTLFNAAGEAGTPLNPPVFLGQIVNSQASGTAGGDNYLLQSSPWYYNQNASSASLSTKRRTGMSVRPAVDKKKDSDT